MRQPDEFVTFSARALEYAQAHQRTVLWIAIAVLGVILGGIALASFRLTQWQQANTNLARAMALFNENKLPEAISAFDDLAEQGGTPEIFAEIARLYSAQAYLRQGEFARATAGFEAASGAGGFLGQRALVNRGYALEGNQQHADAAQQFAAAVQNGGPYTAVAILGEARNAELAGDKPRAKAAYQKLLTDFPEAPEKQLAEGRLASLE